MMLHALYAVARELPYSIDNTAPINKAFKRLHQTPTDADKRLIDLWTYCYIYRYFLVKLSASNEPPPLSLDRIVDRTFAEVQKHVHRIRRPGHYTGWIGTICRNMFVNHLRAKRSTVSFEDEVPVVLVEQPELSRTYDACHAHEAVCSAIEELPPFLRDIARMRLLENRSYKSISQETGKSKAILRSYLNKTLALLRQNPALRSLFNELRD